MYVYRMRVGVPEGRKHGRDKLTGPGRREWSTSKFWVIFFFKTISTLITIIIQQ